MMQPAKMERGEGAGRDIAVFFVLCAGIPKTRQNKLEKLMQLRHGLGGRVGQRRKPEDEARFVGRSCVEGTCDVIFCQLSISFTSINATTCVKRSKRHTHTHTFIKNGILFKRNYRLRELSNGLSGNGRDTSKM
eukprot:gnl/TRDRNA2_/TRDRNA2_76691_c1_seq1.p1 gnl/TRDRNA2_/TRDRNA2_76691_c1~~gnl/TRDRNA2_/TRDRNA2_76691_c1_seq1.p1  ORF type:complete len:134 (-),score=3.71 gnl/TRDRNA2_/TRDRNA2_76691_c1_seq1:80-481(-)